jgi:uncharacterized membrane protein
MKAHHLSPWDYAAGVLTALQVAAGVYIVRYGPDAPVPMHFNAHGHVDRWGDKGEAALVIFVCAFVTLAAHLVLNWTAARAALDRGAQRMLTSGRVIGLATPTTVALPFVYLGSGLARDASPETAPMIALMGAWVVIALAGATLGKTTPNPWIGMRVYWTYKSRLAWEKSNRLLGRIYFFGGLAGLILTPFGDFPSRIALFVTVVVGGAIASVFEAWRTWRVDPERTA